MIAQLSTVWLEKSNIWQIRCAETLSEGKPKQSLSILFSMLALQDKILSKAVVDSLNRIAYSTVKISLTSNQLSIINKLSERGGLIAIVSSQFLQNIST